LEEVKTAAVPKSKSLIITNFCLENDKSAVTKSVNQEETKQVKVDKNAVPKDKGPSPKKALSPWMFFNTDFVTRARAKDQSLKPAELFKQASEKWKTISDKEKAQFEKMAEEDKIRHEKQVAEREKKGYFTLEDKSKSTDPENAKLFKKKKSKDADEDDGHEEILQPKRAISAYIYFSQEFIEQARKSHPDKKQSEYMGMAGSKWSEMSESQKKPYNDMNAVDKVRQEKQEAELAKKGFFVLADGSKSTDSQNVPKKRKI
jgi:hypothetical protein